MRLSSPLLTVLSGVALLAVAACADQRPTPTASQPLTPTQSMSASFYRTMNSPNGNYYATTDGRTLYHYRRDPTGASTCYGDCTMQGRPYLAANDARGDGDWTIIQRRDGTRQWAYRGRPVYTWHRDMREGDMYGNGGDWIAVTVGIR